MTLTKLLIIGVMMLTGLVGYGQQDAHYTQYMYNMNVLNPAYAGSQGTLNIGLFGRTQWVGLKGAPRTMTAAIHAPVGKNVGLGLSIIADQIGAVKEQNTFVDFSYTLKVSDQGRLAFGLKGGFTFQNIDFLSLTIQNEQDPLFSNNLNKTYPNFGVGSFYYTEHFYVGLSMPNMLKTRHFEKGNGIISSASENMHYFITSGYVFDVLTNLKLKPSLMVKAIAGTPVSLDLSVNAMFYNSFELGLSWREGDSVSAMTNFLVAPDLRIGYAYDYTLTNLGEYNTGSHEVFILYNLDLSRGNLNSPRFF